MLSYRRHLALQTPQCQSSVCNSVSVVPQGSPLLTTHRAVQPQREQHQEEDDGKEGGSWHVCNGLCIGDEEQAGSCSRELGSLLASAVQCLPGENFSPQAALPRAVSTTSVKLQVWLLCVVFMG